MQNETMEIGLTSHFAAFALIILLLVIIYQRTIRDVVNFILIRYMHDAEVISKYESICDKLDTIQRSLRNLQTNQDAQRVSLTLEMTLIQDFLKELQIQGKHNVGQISNFSGSGAATEGAPPPPPPPPPPPAPMFLATPIPKPVMASRLGSGQASKKTRDGPPQLTVTAEQVKDRLNSLRKTSFKSKLVENGSKQSRNTPPRRKLYSRNSNSGNRLRRSQRSPSLFDTSKTTPVSRDRFQNTIQKIDFQDDDYKGD